jgi:hypothetical protein
MSPEQANGENVDARTDVYSLAVVLFEMLTGKPPYTGATAMAIVAKWLTDPVPRAGAVRPEVPETVDQALGRALARTIADRTATMADFARELRGAPPGFTPVPTPPEARTAALTPPGAAGRRWIPAALLLAFLLAAGGVFLAWRHAGARATASAAPKVLAVLPFDNLGDSADAYFDRLRRRALASGRMYEPITVDVNRDATVANVSIPIAGKTTDRESDAALALLREEIVPETVGRLPGAETGVTGLAAQWKDATDELKSNLAPVIAFVLLFAFGLLLVAFRSLVVAVKAMLLNLLSVAAAYGVLVLVFQHGVGKGVLGFSSTAGISPEVPLLLFVILFGLSMDYHVLVLGRIRELYDRGQTMDEAISNGIKRTAGVVTSAAVVMVFVFSIFATLSLLFFKQFGVGLAVAILIDATIVRAVLLPATMKLLGDRNWYLPSWLRWLPRLDASERAPELPAAPSV